MELRLLLLILFVSQIGYAQNRELENHEIANINNVISLFKQNNVDKISSIIKFPLRREYPIPNIKDKKEFKQRFHEVFDKTLIDKIANSKIEQWSEVGWRGIMLDDGIVWIQNLDGKITAVNYQSDFEKRLIKELIAEEKASLHTSLKNFKQPTYRLKTKSFLIRIDEISNGKYRFASWKRDGKESSKPDIILNNGKLVFEGSGGNHVIIFPNGNYTYKVYRNLIGEYKSPDITLIVEKDGQSILEQGGTLITK
ncbi:MAG: hypothetical protein QM727_01200 [Niabella sp.]